MIMRLLILSLVVGVSITHAWVVVVPTKPQHPTITQLLVNDHHSFSNILLSTKSKSTTKLHVNNKSTIGGENNDETTITIVKKYGLEIGLVESLKKQDGGESAKSLLKRYGIAYLVTSIPLAILSFTICYILIDNGIDISSLLLKLNIDNTNTNDQASTFALAYAAHKAASPIRFPPTVALTPIVAKIIGKEPDNTNEKDNDDIKQQ